MKLFSFLALATATVLTYTAVNPIQVQAAETTPLAVIAETMDPTANFEAELFTLVNEERARHGLYAYELDELVNDASETRIGELEEIFSHNRDGGKRFSSILVESDISYSLAAEIIAAGQTSPKAVLDAWLNSPNHCKRILSDDYTKVGVAHDRTEDGTDYWEILFIREK